MTDFVREEWSERKTHRNKLHMKLRKEGKARG